MLLNLDFDECNCSGANGIQLLLFKRIDLLTNFRPISL